MQVFNASRTVVALFMRSSLVWPFLAPCMLLSPTVSAMLHTAHDKGSIKIQREGKDHFAFRSKANIINNTKQKQLRRQERPMHWETMMKIEAST